ncbi:S41 family peptidase [Chitinophaga solisilvae]|uniref:Uncharacterized protein n=1 Tax=Chitinophaga solisilvae TaxID=1233460 RepID=A0A433WDA9_9BACT|nr:S41 family peptidase [Chitinophaga solisilvae]NSL89466.1 hypothetical protein [Chitinophaga solisilvae]
MQPKHLKIWLLAGMALLFLLPSCKKKDVTQNPQPSGDIRDSIYFVFKDIYLWSDAIPDSATFRPESYNSVETMFNALIQYKKNNTSGLPLDKYSFLDNGSTSGTLQGGIAGDMGFEIGFQTQDALHVIYVYPGSPADKAGIKRGWQLTAIGNVTSLHNDDATNKLLDQAFFGGNGATFTFRRPDGNTPTISIKPSLYPVDPILYSRIYTFNGVKVGYFVFNTFVALQDTKAKMDSIFNAFTQAGVQKLVVDLRYNTGGLLETAEYMADLLVPAALTNSVMYTQVFNDNVYNNKFSRYLTSMRAPGSRYTWAEVFRSEATNYRTTRFNKQGALDLTQLRFLVTKSTVSASELLYNVLKPGMKPRLIGRKTFGKPVGFINIPFGRYDMYAACFQTYNSANEGAYFDGIAPDINLEDDYTTDWGTLSDPLLRNALLDMGIPSNQLGRMTELAPDRLGIKMKGRSFQGMIQRHENR